METYLLGIHTKSKQVSLGDAQIADLLKEIPRLIFLIKAYREELQFFLNKTNPLETNTLLHVDRHLYAESKRRPL